MTTLLGEVKDGIAVLTLHRPDKLNALDYALVDALGTALDELEAEDGVRAVILTGSGDRAFSAGADIAEFAGSVEGGVDRALREFVRRGQRLTRQIEGYSKALIVAVNGIAFGAGCEITESGPAGAGQRSRPLRETGDPAGVPATLRRYAAAAAPDRQEARAADDPHGRADRRAASGVRRPGQPGGRACCAPRRGAPAGRPGRSALPSRGGCVPAQRHPGPQRIHRRGAGHRGHAVCFDGADARHPPGHRRIPVPAQVTSTMEFGLMRSRARRARLPSWRQGTHAESMIAL